MADHSAGGIAEPHELEQLAVQLASLPAAKREWILVRTRDLVKLSRAVGLRLSGKREDTWGRLVVGGLIYDADGEALCRVRSVSIKGDRVDHRSGRRRVTTTIEITAHAFSEDQ